MTTMMLTTNDEWGEWEMGDFGFYEDLDDDNDIIRGDNIIGIGIDSTRMTYSSSSNLFSGPPTPSDISSNSNSSSCSPHYHHHHAIQDPQPSTLTSHPPILTSTTIDQLNDHDVALPWSLQDDTTTTHSWVRLFSSTRDGTSFGHFMRSVRNVTNTIVVAKTSGGMVVGGFTMDVWSGRKGGGGEEEERMGHDAFLFVVEPPASASASADTTSANKVKVSPSHQQLRVKRFIPGLEDLASSPTGVLEFNFDALSLTSSDKIVDNNKEEEEEVHIFKPSSRQAPLKQVCQLGNKFISLGEDADDSDSTNSNGGMKNLLTIENSFSKGQVIMTLNDGRCIMEEFDVVNFEVYCLSDDDDD